VGNRLAQTDAKLVSLHWEGSAQGLMRNSRMVLKAVKTMKKMGVKATTNQTRAST